MFEIGFGEILLVAVVALLVLGPERLPGAIRTVRHWSLKLRRTWGELRDEIERSVDIDELKRDLHNDAIMKGLKETPYEIDRALRELDQPPPSIQPPAKDDKPA